MDKLDSLRQKIDEIDSELVRLFEERMAVVTEVAKYKQDSNMPILDKDREMEVIKKNVERLKDDSLQNEAEEFFESLMGVSRKYQAKKITGKDSIIIGECVPTYENSIQNKKIKAGFQGVSGSFSEQALHEYFGQDVEKKCVNEFEDIFIELQKGNIDYGILPIENSSTGSILAVYDLLRKYDFFITGEKCINVEQNLLANKGASLSDIKEVYTIQTAYDQSSVFFKKHQGIKFIPYHNTAASAEYIKNTGDIHKAAIASKMAAKVFDLDVLAENINYNKNNRTRFIIVSRDMNLNEECDKISVLFALEHKAGSLYNALRFFAENNLSMLKIESRPIIDKSWQYFFYIDFEGNMEEKKVKEALNLIERNSCYFRLLGNYKKSC